MTLGRRIVAELDVAGGLRFSELLARMPDANRYSVQAKLQSLRASGLVERRSRRWDSGWVCTSAGREALRRWSLAPMPPTRLAAFERVATMVESAPVAWVLELCAEVRRLRPDAGPTPGAGGA